MTVTVMVPRDTMTTLSPVITIDGASVSPASGVEQNFAFLVPYTVTAMDGSKAQWIVTVKWEALESDADIGTYLASASGGDTAEDPITLPVSINLASGWTDLLSAINTEGKYVALDLSACTGGGAEFDPGTADTGEQYIVSLVLPDAATSIKAGTYPDSTFKHFTALKSVTGGAVTSIGERAFSSCTSLETVNFPAAATIGYYAFGHCTNLTTVNIPSITTINYAFYYCTSLTSITLPASLTSMEGNPFYGCINLTTITVTAGNPDYKHSDDYKMLLSKAGTTLIAYPSASGSVNLSGITNVGPSAFRGCTGLTSITLPAATTVGGQAFDDCSNLTTVSLPEAASIGSNAFLSCRFLVTLNLPKATSIGSLAFQFCYALEELTLPAAQSIGGSIFRYCTALETVTLGDTVPTLGDTMFNSITDPQSVTVKVPNNTAWSGIIGGSFTGSEDTGGTYWGEGFRGKGWTSGGAYEYDGYYSVNENITLTIEALP